MSFDTDFKISSLIKSGRTQPTLSKFLTIDEQRQLLRKDLKVVFSESYPNEERKRAVLYPEDSCFEEFDFEIALIKITGLQSAKHKDVLGSIMGLGISREVVGDIVLDNQNAFVFVMQEMATYCMQHLQKVAKHQVDVEEVPYDTLQEFDINPLLEATIIVPSYRLDAIVSKAVPLSREKAKQYIALGNVRVDGKIQQDADYICKIGNRISMARKGKVVIEELQRKTKKGNLVVVIKKSK